MKLPEPEHSLHFRRWHSAVAAERPIVGESRRESPGRQAIEYSKPNYSAARQPGKRWSSLNRLDAGKMAALKNAEEFKRWRTE